MRLLQNHCPESTLHIRNTHTKSSQRLLDSSPSSSLSGLPGLQASSDDEADEPTQSVISAPARLPKLRIPEVLHRRCKEPSQHPLIYFVLFAVFIHNCDKRPDLSVESFSDILCNDALHGPKWIKYLQGCRVPLPTIKDCIGMRTQPEFTQVKMIPQRITAAKLEGDTTLATLNSIAPLFTFSRSPNFSQLTAQYLQQFQA